MVTVSDFTAITSDELWRDGFGDLRKTITFGFADRLFDHQADVDNVAFRNSFEALNRAERDVARAAFQQWADVSGLRFVEVDAEDADITLGLFDFDTSAARAPFAGFAFFPGQSRIAGDVFIDQGSSDELGLYVHEIGHALGLEHPDEGPRILAPALDDRSTTIMSRKGNFVDTVGPLDIEAIRSMYGGPASTPAGNTLALVGYADLFISASSFPFFGAIDRGESDSFSSEVTNSRFAEEASEATTLIAVLSRDETLSADDAKVGEVAIPALAVGESTPFQTVEFTVPAQLDPGGYFVIVAVDPDNLSPERDDTNNFDVLGGITVTSAAPRAGAPQAVVSPFADGIGPRRTAEATAPGDGDSPLEPGIPGVSSGLIGTAGDDTLSGGRAAERLKGKAGEDLMSGGGRSDTMAGGAGDDTMLGGGGMDTLKGGGGADELDGGRRGDFLKGGGGGDLLLGGGGFDFLNGGGGADTLDGGKGKDNLRGNGGADVFRFTGPSGDDDIVDFQDGIDMLQVEGPFTITQQGEDVRVDHGGGEFIIRGVGAVIDESDFIL